MIDTTIESVVSMPILNPETGARSRTFEYWGVVDKLEGSTIIDWKSTDDPARFIHQKRIGLQAELYALALKAAGVHVDTIEYRLIQKPGLKFSPATYKWAVMKAGRKSAVKVCETEDEAKKLAVMQGGTVEKRVKGDDGRDKYEERCLSWVLEDPTRMVTHSHHLTSARLDQAKHLLWESTKRILDNRRTGRWLANEHACFNYNRECECLPLCECEMMGGDTDWIIEDQYEVVDDLHPELGGVERSKDVLTYSSCSKLRLCEVKYYWQVERGLRRRGRDTGDALWIGSAMHAGLEAYAKGGVSEALPAIDQWAESSPIIGEVQARFQDQQIGKARAMVRAAAIKWGS
ncbi:MAG: PD-(D/E)XK nuclease family protein [Planctomycetota bacterium]|nr:PD-(D/E)XK nuclease family protein [Planctomycetota bacterium]